MDLIKDFKNLGKDDVALAGGKGASLGEMTQAGLPVPNGFVILSNVFEKFLEETDLNVEIDAILHSVNLKEIHTIENASEKIQSLIIGKEMPSHIKNDIQKYFKKLDAKFVAVRSSATAEDSSSAAWAGQLESFLNTTDKNLLENVKNCWASLFTPRAIFYRFEKELHAQKISVAVVVQKMVESEKSGIAFSVHPVTQDKNQIIIEAGFGLGEAIVSGQITPDSYVIEKQPRRIIDKNIEVQTKGLYRAGDVGNEWCSISKVQGEKQVLSDEEIFELSEVVLKIENHYHFPCDIEWALEKNKFYIVQSRPITTLNNQNKEFVTLLDKFMKGFEKDVFYPLVPVSILAAGSGGFSPNFGGKVKNLNIKFLIAMKEAKAFVLMSETRYNMISENFFTNYIKNQSLLPETISYLNEMENEINRLYLDLSYKNINFLKEKEIIRKLKRMIDLAREYNCTAWFSTQFDKKLVFEFINRNNLKLDPKSIEKIWDRAIIPTEDSFDKRRHKVILKLLLGSEHIKVIAEKMQYAYSGYTKIKSIKEIESEIKKEYSKYITHDKKILKELEKEELEYKKIKKSFKNWRNSLSAKEKKVVDYIQTILVLRDKRKDIMGKGIVVHFRVGERFFEDIGLNTEFIYYCAYEEFLKGKDYLKNRKEEISNRSKGVIFLHNYNGSIEFEYNDFENTKNKMEKIYLESQEVDRKLIIGQIAYRGDVKGKVKIILRHSEFSKFKKGDILVTSMTRPEFVPLMKIAKAIITDEGGITSHAAIISREMEIPCIIGTKIATKILKDGDFVEIDSKRNLVKIINQKQYD